jgi:G3E family GTPase
MRVIVVGGFLGAGKTTLMAQAAKHFASEGKRVAIITNDQAADLVDIASIPLSASIEFRQTL